MVARPRISPGISESEGLPTTAPRLPQYASPCLDGREGYSSNAAPALLQETHRAMQPPLSNTHTGPGDQRQAGPVSTPGSRLSPRTPSLQGLTRPRPSAAVNSTSPHHRETRAQVPSQPHPGTPPGKATSAQPSCSPLCKMGALQGPPRNANMKIKHEHADSGHRLTAGLEAATGNLHSIPMETSSTVQSGRRNDTSGSATPLSLPDQRRALITKDSKWGKNADDSLGPEEASGLPEELNLRQRLHRTLPQLRGGRGRGGR